MPVASAERSRGILWPELLPPFASPPQAVICKPTASSYWHSLHRDAVDLRVIENVRHRTGKVIDSQNEVGGWPLLRSAAAPADRDHDGIPDAWETAHGLNPNDPLDRNAVTGRDGYTNLEKYLNSLCPTPSAD